MKITTVTKSCAVTGLISISIGMSTEIQNINTTFFAKYTTEASETLKGQKIPKRVSDGSGQTAMMCWLNVASNGRPCSIKH